MSELFANIPEAVWHLLGTIAVTIVGASWFGDVVKDKFAKNSNKKIVETLDKLNEKIDGNEKKNRERMDLIAEGQMHVLQDRLLYLSTKYLDRNYVYTNELKSYTNMYKTYHALGGNDFITELYERVKDLPLKKQDSGRD